MAIPTIFAQMARLGLSAAYKIRPTKLKRGLRKVSKYTTKARFDATKNPNLSKWEGTLIKGLKGAGKHTFKGYSKAYKGTLGSSTKRKVTSGVLGGAVGWDILDRDD